MTAASSEVPSRPGKHSGSVAAGAFLVLSVFASSLFAEDSKRTHEITVDDYFTLDVILQQQISPNGAHVAYTLARWDKSTNGRRTGLWTVNTRTKKRRRLTFSSGAGI